MLNNLMSHCSSRMKHRSVFQYMKSKQLSFIEKFVCSAILTANSVYRFSEMYFSYGLNFTANKKQFFESNDITLDFFISNLGFRLERGLLNSETEISTGVT